MLRVAIAGFGVVGKRRKECLAKNPHVNVVAVCDRVLEGVSQLDDGTACYMEYTQLLGQELDILFVCLPNDMAAAVTIFGLENGLHVFCEKPPGRSVAEVIEVAQISKERPEQKLMYGFNHRYHESVARALAVIDSGELGRVINLRGVYGKAKLITFNQPDWRTQREIAGGGVLLDQGIHMVDLMRLFGGEFNQVHSFISNSHWGYDVEDNVYALMKGKTGVVAMLNSSATQWRHRFNLDINLEKGSLILGGILSGTKSYGAETLTVVRADPDNDRGDPFEELTRYNRDPSWQIEIDSFVDCVKRQRPVTSGSVDDAVDTMKLVFSIYHADSEWRTKYGINDPDEK